MTNLAQSNIFTSETSTAMKSCGKNHTYVQFGICAVLYHINIEKNTESKQPHSKEEMNNTIIEFSEIFFIYVPGITVLGFGKGGFRWTSFGTSITTHSYYSTVI